MDTNLSQTTQYTTNPTLTGLSANAGYRVGVAHAHVLLTKPEKASGRTDGVKWDSNWYEWLVCQNNLVFVKLFNDVLIAHAVISYDVCVCGCVDIKLISKSTKEAVA